VSYDSATHIATLVPDTSLTLSTTYTASLGSPIADLAGNLLAPVTWSFSTAGPPPDTTPPTVIASNPASGASGVDLATNVSATFSEALNASTANASSVTLVDGSLTSVPATVPYTPANRTVTLDPNAELAPNSSYTARLSGAIA